MCEDDGQHTLLAQALGNGFGSFVALEADGGLAGDGDGAQRRQWVRGQNVSAHDRYATFVR